MSEHQLERCRECPMLKTDLEHIRRLETMESAMIMAVVAEDTSSVVEAIRHSPELPENIRMASDEEIIHDLRAGGNQVVEMISERTKALWRELAVLSFGCGGPLTLTGERAGVGYAATICAAPIRLEENDGPTPEVVVVDRKEVDEAK